MDKIAEFVQTNKSGMVITYSVDSGGIGQYTIRNANHCTVITKPVLEEAINHFVKVTRNTSGMERRVVGLKHLVKTQEERLADIKMELVAAQRDLELLEGKK